MRKLVGLAFKVVKEMVETRWLLVPHIKQHDARKMSLGIPRFQWKSEIIWLARWDTCSLIFMYIDQFVVPVTLYRSYKT